MKKITLLLLLLAISSVGGFKLKAQSSPWEIGVGAHAVDFVHPNSKFMEGVFDTNQWKASPILTRFYASKQISRLFDVDFAINFGEIDNEIYQINDEVFVNAGLGAKLHLGDLILGERGTIDPFVRVGANYHKFDYSSIPLVNDEELLKTLSERGDADAEEGWDDHYFAPSIGLGVNVWVTENLGLNLASEYNWNMGPDTFANFNNLGDFMQHSATVVYGLGSTDSDGDGVSDKNDQCPNVPGLPQFGGCPDSDGDGLRDSEDNCPNEPGPISNGGCPMGDRDNDGVPDDKDACPDTPGSVQNQGCPVVADIVEEVNQKIKFLEFDTNKATIRASSYPIVEEAATKIMSVQSQSSFYVDGHTDTRGSSSYNMDLSKRRAAAVASALVNRGVEPTALTPRGFGETQPKCTPELGTAELQCNRRVEIHPFPRR